MQLGTKAKDTITGFSGVVTGKASYITGCDQFLLQPQCKEDGDMVDGRWFDEQRLEIVPDTPATSLDNSRGNGACGVAPVK